MALPLDLDGPLREFLDRTQQIRAVSAMAEAVLKDPATISSSRPEVDFATTQIESTNTANAMSVVFLASSFEEFYREEVREVGIYLSVRYANAPIDVKYVARDSYWSIFLDKTRRLKSFVVSKPIFSIDQVRFSEMKLLVDGVSAFVVNDNATGLDGSAFSHHSNNFRPSVVDEIGRRIGIKSIVNNSADAAAIKAHFGVVRKSESYERLVSKLTEFYQLRNNIVHSLNTTQGVGIDKLYEYIKLFEIFADAIKASLARHVAAW